MTFRKGKELQRVFTLFFFIYSEPMSPQDKRLVTGIFKKLWNCPFATPFLQPVDPVYFNIPDYFDIIKHPMDLSTIQKKLDDYHSKEEFIADVELMLNNCYLYNNPTDPVCDTAREFEKMFKKQLIKLRATPPVKFVLLYKFT